MRMVWKTSGILRRPSARSFLMYGVVRNLLFRLPPETAHNVTLNSLDVAHKLGILNVFSKHPAPCPVNVMGLEFPNPVGLAAGLDKNADHLDALDRKSTRLNSSHVR